MRRERQRHPCGKAWHAARTAACWRPCELCVMTGTLEKLQDVQNRPVVGLTQACRRACADGNFKGGCCAALGGCPCYPASRRDTARTGPCVKVGCSVAAQCHPTEGAACCAQRPVSCGDCHGGRVCVETLTTTVCTIESGRTLATKHVMTHAPPLSPTPALGSLLDVAQAASTRSPHRHSSPKRSHLTWPTFRPVLAVSRLEAG